MKQELKDIEGDEEVIVKNQWRLNGHMPMLLKTFMVGADWSHEARLRLRLS